MTVWPFVGRRERLRRQASDWIAKLNGPHDEHDRAAFDRWYRASADNAATYDRLAAVFDLASRVSPDARSTAFPVDTGRRNLSWPVRYALPALSVATVVLVLAIVLRASPADAPSPAGAMQTAVLAASAEEPRHVVLADGSEVTLSPGAELEVALGDGERRMWLRRGEGRFEVFHEARPFVVQAQGAEVRARGTLFVVRLGTEGPLISLIEGRVEVSFPSPADPERRSVALLSPGDQMAVPTGHLAPPPSGEHSPRSGMIEFDDTPLAEAVRQINLRADRKIYLADAALEELRITGGFRTGDAPGFAQAAAAALGLQLQRKPDGTLWLRGRD